MSIRALDFDGSVDLNLISKVFLSALLHGPFPPPVSLKRTAGTGSGSVADGFGSSMLHVQLTVREGEYGPCFGSLGRALTAIVTSWSMTTDMGVGKPLETTL